MQNDCFLECTVEIQLHSLLKKKSNRVKSTQAALHCVQKRKEKEEVQHPKTTTATQTI